MYFGQKAWKEAESYLVESLQNYDGVFGGEPSPYIGGTLLNLAIVYRNMKVLEKAETLYYKGSQI